MSDVPEPRLALLGGGFSTDDDGLLDDWLLGHARVARPRVCFVPTASGDAPAYVERFLAAGVLYGPGKAANAGGVAVSGLELSQGALRLKWSRDEVDARLREIMRSIHAQCRATAAEYGREGNYVDGANIAGFLKVADAMLDQGVV